MAKAIAKNLGYRYIDSGAMYRGVTYFIQQKGITLDQLQAMNVEAVDDVVDEIHLSFQINPETGESDLFLNEPKQFH